MPKARETEVRSKVTISLTVEVDAVMPGNVHGHFLDNVANIFYALTVGSSDTEDATKWFGERFANEIQQVHRGVEVSSILLCSSTDPTDHQGNLCPIHEV